MNPRWITAWLLLLSGLTSATGAEIRFAGAKKLNNLVTELLDVTAISEAGESFTFSRPRAGWIFVSVTGTTQRTVRLLLDQKSAAVIHLDAESNNPQEAMRYVAAGQHTLRIAGQGQFNLRRLEVRAIPELIHCGLGFDPAIKAYGHYDWDFLKADVLPNVTTLIVPNHIKLPAALIADWHGQGKRFVGEVGTLGEGKAAADYFKYWTRFYDQAPFLDGIIIDEFIVNRPVVEWVKTITPARRARMAREREQYNEDAAAIRRIHADPRYRNKTLYAYIGGSGKKLNQEIIGTNLLQTLVHCGYHIALERYLHEMSSPQGSAGALHLLVNGVADWATKVPGVKPQMVIAFGLLSMPPGSLDKLPNVDYHVWMDQQMNLVANNPTFAGIGGLEWWTSSLADEETVRFVGKLYRHYAIEGKTGMLTHDPLFMTHLRNPDFAHGTTGWTLHAAGPGTIAVKRFPRYGRIEGRFMGLGRPPDPEHIGDTFLWMKRSRKGPNTFSQTIKGLEPGRLYSLKMFSCNYDDLIHPKRKKISQANSKDTVTLTGVDLDTQKSFDEVYASSPEPKIPVCITYYWRVFRAKAHTAQLTVSDWQSPQTPGGPIGQEQVFNFLEVEPYHQ